MTIDLDAQIRLADLRARVLEQEEARKRGEPVEPISAQEYRELILDLRRGRDLAAAQSSQAKARNRKQPKSPLNLNELFGKSTHDDE